MLCFFRSSKSSFLYPSTAAVFFVSSTVFRSDSIFWINQVGCCESFFEDLNLIPRIISWHSPAIAPATAIQNSHENKLPEIRRGRHRKHTANHKAKKHKLIIHLMFITPATSTA